MDKETQENQDFIETTGVGRPQTFEDYCCNCDNFPGDIYGTRPGYDAEHGNCRCPFQEKFKTGEFNCNTQWRAIKCEMFWD